jgi:hypothetical protein
MLSTQFAFSIFKYEIDHISKASKDKEGFFSVFQSKSVPDAFYIPMKVAKSVLFIFFNIFYFLAYDASFDNNKLIIALIINLCNSLQRKSLYTYNVSTITNYLVVSYMLKPEFTKRR